MKFRVGMTKVYSSSILPMLILLLGSGSLLSGICHAVTESPIRVGSELEFPPYAFVDKDGQPAGFSVELIRTVADSMGLPIKISTGPWDVVWNELVTRRLDVLPIVAKLPQRQPLVDFSLPHTETFDAFFVRKGTPSIQNIDNARGKEVVVMREDAAHHALLERNFQGNLIVVGTIPEGLSLIASGKHDAFLCSKLIGTLTIKEHGIRGLVAGPPIPDYKRTFSFAVKKGDPELLEKLNQGLLIIKTSGEYNRLYEKWLTADDPWRKWEKYLLPAAGVVTAIVLIGGFWLLVLQLMVKKRTRDLAEANLALRQSQDSLGERVTERTAELAAANLALQTENTERKRAEEASRESRTKLEAALNSMTDAVFICDSKGRFVNFNEAYAKYYRFKSKTEWVKSLPELPKVIDVFLPDGAPVPLEVWPVSRALRGEKGNSAEYMVRRKDTGETWFGSYSFAPIRDEKGAIVGSVVNARDITERKRMEEELRKSRDELEIRVQERTEEIQKQAELIDLARDAIILEELDGPILLWSEGAVDMYGWTKEEAIGKVMREMLNTEYLGPRNEIMSQLVHGGQWEGELSHTRKDGTKLKVLSRLVLKRTAGETDKVIIINRDITQRVKMEEALHQAQKMEALGTLSGGIAHDFNNLLVPILLNLEMAIMDIQAGELPKLESLETAMAGATRGKELVQQIITFSRHKGKVLKPVDLAPITKETIKFLRATSPATVRFETRVEDPSPLVMANATQIHQVLMNLTSNAVHAMEKHGGVLELTLEKVDKAESDGMKPGSYVCLKVKDTGCGMTREVREKAFDPFFTTKAKGKGTGMGLAVVHGIVKRHGGEIRLESEIGKGTTVSVFLPVHEEAKKEDPPRPFLGVLTGSERILFIDDEEVQTRTVREMLKRLGYGVEVETDPRKALEMFRGQPDAFDLVITDQVMPNLTGTGLSKELLSVRSDLPIIICTGHSDQIDEEKTPALGIKGFIQKPFTIIEISQSIRKALGHTDVE